MLPPLPKKLTPLDFVTFDVDFFVLEEIEILKHHISQGKASS